MDKKSPNCLVHLESEIIENYCSDYSKKMHVREIARLMNANHRTVSLALQKLERTKIMKYQLAGKNKIYFLNLDNILTKKFLESVELMKTVKFIERYFIIKKLLAEASKDIRSAPLIVFGSYAKGSEKKESDLDIMIIKGKNETLIIKKLEELSKHYNIKLHIQKTDSENFEKGLRDKDYLIIEIVKNHVILNNAEFFVDVLWRYYHER